MSLFEVTANDKKIYEEELKDFLPDKMLDIHTHIWRRTTPRPAVTAINPAKRTVNWPSLVAWQNPIEDLQETYRLMFPGKEISAMMFGGGYTDAANNYISECSKQTGWPALYYSHPTQTADEVERKVREGGFLGLKSYLDLAPKYIPGPEIRIYDFFPRWQLERMNEMGAIVMLHIPRNGRLKDPVNLHQICEIKADFPNLKLIVAHIGRAYTKEDIGDAFTMLDQCSDLLYDFSANCCRTAIAEVIRHAGPKRVLFGSDLPILRMRTHRIEENGTYINLIPPGLYGDPKQDPHLREVSPEEAEKITFFMYEELLAFKDVATELKLSRSDIEDIMYGNARRLLDGVRASIYGE